MFRLFNFELGLAGLACGLASAFFARRMGRRVGGLVFVVAAAWAGFSMHRRDAFPDVDRHLLMAVGVLVLTASAVHAMLRGHPQWWRGVAVGAVTSVAGVFVGVPETSPAVIVAGVLVGVILATSAERSVWAPTAAVGLTLIVGWAAITGAVGRPWATVGGGLCVGVAPWLAVRRGLPRLPLALAPGPWLLAAHGVIVVAAARWIGVVPDAGWPRVAVVVGAGLATVLVTKPT